MEYDLPDKIREAIHNHKIPYVLLVWWSDGAILRCMEMEESQKYLDVDDCTIEYYFYGKENCWEDIKLRLYSKLIYKTIDDKLVIYRFLFTYRPYTVLNVVLLSNPNVYITEGDILIPDKYNKVPLKDCPLPGKGLMTKRAVKL